MNCGEGIMKCGVLSKECEYNYEEFLLYSIHLIMYEV